MSAVFVFCRLNLCIGRRWDRRGRVRSTSLCFEDVITKGGEGCAEFEQSACDYALVCGLA